MEILNTTDSTDFLWAMAGFPVAPHPRRFHAVFMDLRRLSLSIAIALAATLACPMEAEEAKDIIDRFGLWTDCAPLRLIVEQHRLDSRIQVIARSRLRAARIYDDNGIVPNFYIYIVTAHPFLGADRALCSLAMASASPARAVWMATGGLYPRAAIGLG